MADKKLLLILFLSSLCFATSDNCLQWKMDDSADNNIVIGNDVNGEVIGANSVDINSTCNGFPAFHLNGTSQYVRVTIPYILPSARDNLWTKDPRNPVLSDATYAVSFGQLCKNPVGGWYFFGSKGFASIWRWESTDLVTWSNPVQVLAAGGTGKWDKVCQVAFVFQKPDGSWIMLYRGYSGVLPFRIGKATATDSNAFTRIDNGGVNDGLFPQFGNNYDPAGIILVGDTYYVYVNGDAQHDTQNVYTSTDFETFTAWPGNPISTNVFCSHIWHYNNYYYLLSACDFDEAGTTLYDHAIGLYRSTKPTFDANSRDFLGYPIINDQTYDVRYLDTPSVPTTDVYRTTYAPEFGDILYCIYDGTGLTKPRAQCLASTSLSELEARTPKVSQLYGEKQSYSFWVQFDTLKDGDAVFSVGSSASDSSPVWLCVVKTNCADKVLSLFLGRDYRLSTTALDVNTPYHIVIVESIDNIIMYINGATAGTFTQNTVNTDDTYLYIGAGYKREFLDGYIWDFRIYPTALTATEVVRLYNTGSVYADLSCDCCVNFVDFAILANQWLQAPGVPSADIAPEGGDGVVNFLDLDILVSEWLQCDE